MLRIGLTGGIGAGKSTVSATFNECGGIIVDGDVIAREVVEPGTEGLAKLVDAFGEDILLPDGALNRPALAAKAFVDDERRAKLNGIVHPLVGRRREEIIAAVAEDAVVVEDIPLLVETGTAPAFPLVVVVHADEETRVKRLIKRGMDEADARARIAAQAPEEQRRAIADVLLDNSGSQGELSEQARDLWYQRVLPLAHNIRTREVVGTPPRLVPYNPAWPDDARRIIARIQMACGPKALRVDHIGSTAVPGMDAKDVIDVQVTVSSLAIADELADALADVGYPRIAGITGDVALDGDPSLWRKRIHGAADPGRSANIHLRVDGWPNQQFALLFTDWLRAHPDVQKDFLDHADAEEPWLLDNYRRARDWADAVNWRA
ncbi:MAG: dephospho-CoA kinase [Mycobacterium sp.]